MHDVIIIGGGSAGLTAAIYTCRKKLKTLLVTLDVGGQMLLTEHIENYPGYEALSGPRLMQIFEKQAKEFGTEFAFGKATKVEKIDGGFRIELSNGDKFEGRALILAYGKQPKSLGIPGEEKFLGRGVSTCATCDAPLFKNKAVAVVGGGNSGLEAALLCSSFSSKVYLIHRHSELKGDEITQEKLRTNPKVELVLNSQPLEVLGEKFVSGVVVEDIETKQKRTLDVKGLFVEIGYTVKTDFVSHLVKVNVQNEIIINKRGETSCPGIFGAGDITDTPYKQTVISAGEGAAAAMTAYNYLMGLEGKRPVKADWG